MKKWWPMLLILLVVLSIGAGTLIEWSPVTIGADIAFTGLDLRNAATNLPTGGATECVNWVFDKANAIHVRRGLDQWNETTRLSEFTFLSDYTDPGGVQWYLAGNDDTLWIANAEDGDWENEEFTGYTLDYSTVDRYSGSDLISANVAGDEFPGWRRIAWHGDGLILTVDDTATHTIESIMSDSLLRISGTAQSTLSGVDYSIQLNHASVRAAGRVNQLCYIATTSGLYEWDGDELTNLDDSVSYYSWWVDGLEYEYPYTTAIRWYHSDYSGTGGVDPGIGNYLLGKYIFVTSGTIGMDADSTKDDLRGHPYTLTYGPITYAGTDHLATNSAAMPRPALSDSLEIIVADLVFDENYTINFTADSVELDSIAHPAGAYTVYSYYSYVWPDSSWDSTRFETGDWWFKLNVNQTTYYAYSCIIGMIDTVDASGNHAFYVAGYSGELSVYEDSCYRNIDCTIKRRVPSSGFGATNYKMVASYKDRLFTVLEDDPDELRYSPTFDPDNLSGYQTLGLDIGNGDEIEALVVRHGNLEIFTRNSKYILSGDPSLESTILREAYAGVGISAPHGLVEFNGRVFIPHRSGFYLDDGGRPVSISDRIDPIIRDSIDWSLAYDDLCAEYYDGHIWISYPTVNSGGTRTLVYHLDTQRWGNQSFTAAAYHRIIGSSDSNRFMVSLADSGSLCIYKGHLDGSSGITAEYQTGWNDFGRTQTEKSLLGYFVTYDMSDACSLEVEAYRGDTLVFEEYAATSASSQTFHTIHKNVNDHDVFGQYLRFGLLLNSSKADGWISNFTAEISEKGAVRYGK